MSRGRKPGTGAAQARLLEALRSLGTDKEGRPLSIRSAALAERANVHHNALAKTMAALVQLGKVTACMVQPARGNKTWEYRLAAGIAPPQEFKPLNPARAGVALGQPGKPLPATKPWPPKSASGEIEIPVLRKVKPPAGDDSTDTALLERVQAMDEDQLADYLKHLVRVWSWGRAQRIVTAAMATP